MVLRACHENLGRSPRALVLLPGDVSTMAPVVIDIRNADDIRDVVHRAVQTLVEGNLVRFFPTETLYGVAASALNEEAVEKLLNLKSRKAGHPLALAVKSADEAWDYVPQAGRLGRRLARRCWPGPVTLVLQNDHPDSLLKRLPPIVQQAVSPAGTIGLRVPAHRLIMDVLDLLAGPLALTSANRANAAETTTAQEVEEALGDEVQLILDDGRCHYGQASSVVRVTDDGLKMLRGRCCVVQDARPFVCLHRRVRLHGQYVSQPHGGSADEKAVG